MKLVFASPTNAHQNWCCCPPPPFCVPKPGKSPWPFRFCCCCWLNWFCCCCWTCCCCCCCCWWCCMTWFAAETTGFNWFNWFICCCWGCGGGIIEFWLICCASVVVPLASWLSGDGRPIGFKKWLAIAVSAADRFGMLVRLPYWFRVGWNWNTKKWWKMGFLVFFSFLKILYFGHFYAFWAELVETNNCKKIIFILVTYVIQQRIKPCESPKPGHRLVIHKTVHLQKCFKKSSSPPAISHF